MVYFADSTYLQLVRNPVAPAHGFIIRACLLEASAQRRVLLVPAGHVSSLEINREPHFMTSSGCTFLRASFVRHEGVLSRTRYVPVLLSFLCLPLAMLYSALSVSWHCLCVHGYGLPS